MAKHTFTRPKFGIAIAAILALLVTGLTSQAASAATSVGSTASRVLVSPSTSSQISTQLTGADAMTISGFGSSPSTDLVRVEINESGAGQVKFTTTTGLTAVTGGNPINTTAYDSLAFTATVNDANAALAGLNYVSSSGFGSASVSIVVSYAGTGSDLYAFNATNEHFYKYVSTTATFTNAKAAAAATTFNGMTGYLATSTSASENSFITSRVGSGQAWLGGQHAIGVSGTNQWKWVTGPENGTRFFDQTGNGVGTAYNGAYNNWNSGEPNGPTAYLDENSLQIIAGGTGQWNDLVDGSAQQIGYVIEYGGMGETVTKPSTSRTITVDINYPEVKAANTGNCVQNIANTTGVVVLDPNGDGSKCIVKFTNTGSTTWRAPTGVTSVEALIVAGGGGGGAWVGAGGGAGGVILKTGASALTVTPGSSYTVAVGAGGAGATKSGSSASVTSFGVNGSDSTFSTETAIGGGHGRSWTETTPANTGGSGGGGSANTYNAGAAGTAGQGNAGGTGIADMTISTNNGHPGAGGGGAGQVGADVAGTAAGKGGDGISTNISGTTTWYGGGGGGGIHGVSTAYSDGTVGAGGNGGGGSGAGPYRTNYGVVMTTSVTGQAGTANTGGGGGGAGAPSINGYSSTGGAGGSGIVVVSYSGVANPAITTQPSDATKVATQTATFTVAATSPDSGTLSYQWQVLTTAIGATWTDISGATSTSYTTAALTASYNGYRYRAVVTNTIGLNSKTLNSNSALVTMSNVAIVDVAWNELNYDYTAGHYVNKVGTGKAVNDVVLFKNVITRDGTCVDSVVTTKTLTSATVKNYETGTGAGGAKTNFEVDIDFSANNGFGEFQYDFFVCDTYGTANQMRVELRNLAITLIDIDYYQWNEASGMDSFTLASNTKIKYGPAGTPLATGTTIGTTNGTIASYPADVRFQGPSAIDSTIPEDQAIINYGATQTFNVKLGRSASGTPNYFGIAFKSLPWGSTTPTTQGPPTTYTITYDGNGSTAGTAPASQTDKVGANLTVSGNTGTLTRTGYTFGGWNTAANGSGTTYAVGSTIMMPSNGTTLYAIWTPSTLTLTYNANGGTGAPASESRAAGATANLSATTPTRSGYTFGGWATAADGTGSNYSAGASFTMPSSATTLYAKWTAATGTIAYNGNSNTGGAAPSGSTGTSGASYTVLGNTGTLTRTGYTFAGWNTAANGSGTDYATGSTLAYPASGQTITLYAQWTAVLYSLSYNANGGTNSGSGAAPTQSAAYNASLTLASSTYNPTRTGYTFAGWYTTASGTGGTLYAAGATGYLMPASNTVLYAKWTALNFNVTYNSNAPAATSATGSQSDATNYNLNSSVTVLNNGTIAVTNYRFVGWNTLADGTGTDYAAGATFLMPASNVTLYAKWVASNIVLSYDANGGINAPNSTSALASTAITLSASTPTRAGYTFLGWTEASNGSGTVYDPSGAYTTPASNAVLYAKWAAISYTFFYNVNGGVAGGQSAPTSVTGLNIGGLVTVYVVDGTHPAPTRSGYSFTGWNAAADGSSTNFAGGSTYVMGASNYTIYAQWLGNPFTLTYNANGGTVAPSSEVRRADAVAAISASTPTRSGYTFSSWNTAANGSGTTYASSASLTMPASNLTLYAQWTAMNNGVSYNANGGTGAPTGANYNYGDPVTVSSTSPSRTGYTFTGWNTAANGSGTPYSATDVFNMPNGAVVLYAQWTATNYAVDYDPNGGAGAPGTTNHGYNSTVTVSAVLPSRNGYDFQGWNTEAVGTGTGRASSSTFTMPASNVTLYAQWSLATYTVYYNANGGSGNIAAQPGRYNSTITLSNSTPTRPGYTFNGWNTAPNGSGVNYTGGGSLTIPASNVTLYAQWTPISYTLNYDANGGASAPAVEANKTAGQSFTLSASTPTRSGYYFSGWNTVANGSGTNYASSANYTMGTANVTLYALWVLNTYSVSYNANGGTGAPAAQTTSGGTVTIPSSTATVLRPGYTFSHWYTTPSGTGGTQYAPGATFTPSGNIVLYAIWTPLTITVHYNINGGANPGTDTPADQTGVYDGQAIQLAASTGFSKSNSKFLTWNTIADGSGTSYAAEDPNFMVPSSDVTLYAIWTDQYFAVEYNPNGGTGAPNDQFAAPGSTVNVAPSEPSKSGYEFVAWSDVKTGNTYSANAAITMPTSNVTLVANWVVKAASLGGGASSTPAKPNTGLTYPKKLNLTVYFQGDKSFLIPATKTKLQKLAATAKQYGYATSITIYGRVKETNDKSYDAKLSKARAINVAAYLKKLGVKGVFKVIPAGISPENKAISRRVDMSLFWSKR